MTPQKLNRLIEAQSSIAKKVLEAVPAQEAWTPHQIGSALRLMTRASVEIHILRGCLATMKDAGIISEPKLNHFQRVVAKEATPIKEVPMPAPTTPAATIPKPKKSPIDTLGQLAGELVMLSNDFGARLKKLAGQIEEAALAVEQEKEENAKGYEKLQRLQDALKSLQE